MTRKRNLDRHRHSLSEIRNIMNSMKTLSYLEARKLSTFMVAQHEAVKAINDVAQDFLGCFPSVLPEIVETASVYLVIGSERGFCGDFNHSLLSQLRIELQHNASDKVTIIAVGHKLNMLLETERLSATMIDGISIVEETESLLSRIVDVLSSLQKNQDQLTLYCLYNDEKVGIVKKKLLPPFQDLLHRKTDFPNPPLLNLSPELMLTELADHYLFAALHEMVYSSLMSENSYRMRHLEGVVKHLDEESEKLKRQYNAVRQEEIIEEIEVILLNAVKMREI